MKKIPTLFERQYENHKVVGISDKLTDPSFQDILDMKPGVLMTIKYDGTATAVIDGKIYKRYDAKKGKKPPAGAIPCCDPDPITGHWPHWVAIHASDPADKYILAAFKAGFMGLITITRPSITVNEDGTVSTDLKPGTFEAMGPGINGNPYNLEENCITRHGVIVFNPSVKPLTLEYLKNTLEKHHFEGFVFWKDGEPVCKIKRTDFGFVWPIKEETE